MTFPFPLTFMQVSGVVVPDLDGSTPVAAFSTSRLRLTSYAGNPIIRMRRSSDNAESDFGVTALNKLDVDAIATWLGADTGFLVTMYNQTGTGVDHLTQATTTAQPTYDPSVAAINGVPAFLNDGGDVLAGTNPLTAAVVGFSAYITLLSTVSGSDAVWSIGNFAGSASNLIINTSTEVTIYRKRIATIGDATTAAGDGLVTGVPSMFEIREIANDSRDLWLNGVQVATDATSVVGSPAAFTGMRTAQYDSTVPMPGYITDIAVFDDQITDAIRNQIGAGAAYYGATVAPV